MLPPVIRSTFALASSVIAMMTSLILVVSIFSIMSVCAAAEFPAATVPGNAGVNAGVTAPGLDDQDFMSMRKANIRYVRFDLFWHEVETTKGVYDWGRFDPVIVKLKAYGIKPILILDYGNTLYDPADGGIRTDEAREGYARFAAAAVARYSRQMSGIIWEIWNEPNSNDFWKPKRNPDEFVALVKAAVPAMRKADPAATIISGGILELFWDVTQAYLERCFELRLLDEVDGLGVHLYGGRSNKFPERVIEELADLRKRMAAHGARADYPILNTEFGGELKEYARTHGRSAEQQERGQAETYVRMYLLCLLEDVKMTIWYEWRWRDGFSGHAMLNSDGSPRAAYHAIATVNGELDGYQFEKRIHGFGKRDFVLVFKRGSQRKLAVWTAGDTHLVAIQVGASADSFKTTGMTGESGAIAVKDGKFSARLTGSPAYIDLGTVTLDQ